MRDKLKGKRIMVWTFMGNARMYEALRDYGDRIDTIGLFSFKVDKTGTITESGVAISNMLTYIPFISHGLILLQIVNICFIQRITNISSIAIIMTVISLHSCRT